MTENIVKRRVDAIQEFLLRTPSPMAKLYTQDMEVQVNVSQGEGIRETGTYRDRKYTYWTNPDTGERWRNIRIPRKANSDPEYDLDTPQSFSLSKRAEGIGMTGWDWKNRQSKWVGFDFDSLINHKDGITDEEMTRIKNLCYEIDYICVLKSTSGKGLHLYLFFDEPFDTENHNEQNGRNNNADQHEPTAYGALITPLGFLQ